MLSLVGGKEDQDPVPLVVSSAIASHQDDSFVCTQTEMSEAPVELEILRTYNDRLHSLIRGSMITVSRKALSQKLISSEEHSKCTHVKYTDDEKANLFLQYVSSRVENDPRTLSVFLNVLKQEPSFQQAVEGMGEFNYHKDVCRI